MQLYRLPSGAVHVPQPVVVRALWAFAQQRHVSPFSPLLVIPRYADDSVKGTIMDNILYMIPVVWGRLGKSVYELIAAVRAATPKLKRQSNRTGGRPPEALLAAAVASDITSLADVLDVALPVVCGSRKGKSKVLYGYTDMRGLLTATTLLRAVLANQDHVLSDGIGIDAVFLALVHRS